MKQFIALLIVIFIHLASSFVIYTQCTRQEYCGDQDLEKLICEDGYCKGTFNNVHCDPNASPTQCATGLYCAQRGYCDSCIPHCSQCANPFVCTKCENGYYYDRDARACKSGPGNCTTPISNVTCINCNSGFQLKDGLCTNATEGCEDYGILALQCRQCEPNYYVNQDNGCSLGPLHCEVPANATNCTYCSFGYYLDPLTGMCKEGPLNCLVPYNSKFCIICNDGFYWNGLVCLYGPVGCKHFDENNKCLNCIDGYMFNGQICIRGPNNCRVPESTTFCKTCITGYIANKFGECVKGPYYCDVAISEQECKKCYPGYYLNGTRCQGGPLNCKVPVNYTYCSECNGGYYMYYGTCILGKSNCVYITSAMGCNTCITNYFLTEDNACERGPDNCFVAASRKLCQKCMDGFYWDYVEYACKPMPTNCMAVAFKNDDQAICTVCQMGYYLEVTENGPTCSKCNIKNCASCVNSEKCTLCESGFVPNEDGICIPCVVKNCLACSLNITCDNCRQSYYWNETILECTPCLLNCKACSAYSNCSLCNDNYFVNVYNGCTKCPEGCVCVNQTTCRSCTEKFYITPNYTCEACYSSCKNCNGPGPRDCTECPELREMKPTGECGCLTGYQLDVHGDECVKANSGSVYFRKPNTIYAIIMIIIIICII